MLKPTKNSLVKVMFEIFFTYPVREGRLHPALIDRTYKPHLSNKRTKVQLPVPKRGKMMRKGPFPKILQPPRSSEP